MKPVYVTQIRIRKSVVALRLNSDRNLEHMRIYLTEHTENPEKKEIRRYLFECTQEGEHGVRAVLDTDGLELDNTDWDVTAVCAEKEENECPEPVILNGRVRAALILGNYQIKRRPQILFPMGSTGHRLILRCRPKTKYDGEGTRIKEFLAYGIYRLLLPFWRKRRIWVVFEKYCVSAQDNGFYFFQYCMEHLDRQERKRIFFILDKRSEQWSAVEKYRKNVIPFMSFRHILYMLAASLYVASDGRIHGYLWQPRPNLVSREINRHDIFFLQHGVLALKRVESIFGKNGACPVTYFAASSRYEQNIIVREFGYEREKVPVVGLARWDVLENKAREDRKNILIMPTWRSWLEYLSDEEFCESSYYKKYLSLLGNCELLSALKKAGVQIVFYIHPKLRKFMKNFHTDSSLVRLISFGETALNKLLMECSMLVTDYSSVCWDVYYQEKPILFYQFDMEYYRKTNGSYIDMERELFGERCTEEEELVEKLQKYMTRDFVEKEEFAAMREKYFAYRDHHNCERIYAYIAGRGYAADGGKKNQEERNGKYEK